jgi:hypothetical protein
MLALLLTACASGTSDASIRRQAIGVWSSDSQPAKVIESNRDGTCVVKVDGVEKVRGNWWVSNGYLVARLHSATFDGVESNKVIRITAKEVVVLSTDGQTPVTFHRQ